MERNIATKINLYAFDSTTHLPKTGDAANLTVYVTKDDGSVTALTDTSATEMDATNAKGWYTFDVTATESNAIKLLFTGKSTTANVVVEAQLIYTLDTTIERILYVDPDTDGTGDIGSLEAPFDTIAAAMAAVAPGGTIKLLPGTYVEQVVFSQHGVTLEGCGDASLIEKSIAGINRLIEVEKVNCTIKNLKVNCSTAGQAGYANGAHNLVVEGVTFHGHLDGFELYGSDNVQFRRCRGDGNYDAIAFNSCQAYLVEDCYLNLLGAYTGALGYRHIMNQNSSGTLRNVTANVHLDAVLESCPVIFLGMRHIDDTGIENPNAHVKVDGCTVNLTWYGGTTATIWAGVTSLVGNTEPWCVTITNSSIRIVGDVTANAISTFSHADCVVKVQNVIADRATFVEAGSSQIDDMDAKLSAILDDTGTTGVAIVDGGIAAAKIGTGAFTAAKFASDYYTAVITGIWNHLLSGITTAGSIGKIIKDYLDAAVSTRAVSSDLTNAFKVAVSVPQLIERPDTSTQVYRAEVTITNHLGAAVVPDSAPTVSLINQAGTSRTARLDSTTTALVATGRYKVEYTSTSTDGSIEHLTWAFTVVKNSISTIVSACSIVLDTKFNSTHRTNLGTLITQLAEIHDVRLTAPRATALDSISAIASNAGTAVADTTNIKTRIPAALSAGGWMKSDLLTIGADAASLTKFKDLVDTAYNATTHLLDVNLKRVDGIALALHTAGYIPAQTRESLVAQSSPVGVVTSQTVFEINGSDQTSGAYDDQLIVLRQSAVSDTREARRIISHTIDDDVATITIDAAFTTGILVGDTVDVYLVSPRLKNIYDYSVTLETALTAIKGTSFDTAQDSLRKLSTAAVFHADINLFRDVTTDEYTVQWFKNGVPVTAGITSPTIQVVDRSATNLIASTALTEIGSSHAFKKDAITTERIATGNGYLVIVTASIESATRTWKKVIGRDNVV